MLRFASFVKKFHRRAVLEIEDHEIPAGINYVIGGNGSGKTTLLRVLAGRSPFEGEVTFLGKFHPVRDAVEWRRRVSFSDSEPAFPANASGHDMVRLFLNARGGARGSADEIVNRFQMESYLRSSVDSYSAGMKKKLSLLLAFLGDPELILLDEPLITLDNHAREEFGVMIRKKEEAGCNFLISSHLAVNSSSLEANQIWEISEGSLKAATPEAVQTHMPAMS